MPSPCSENHSSANSSSMNAPACAAAAACFSARKVSKSWRYSGSMYVRYCSVGSSAWVSAEMMMYGSMAVVLSLPGTDRVGLEDGAARAGGDGRQRLGDLGHGRADSINKGGKGFQ